MTYEAIAKKTEEHDAALKDLTKQVTSISSYLQAMKDFRLLAVTEPAAAASTTTPVRHGPAPAPLAVLRPLPILVSSALPEPPAPPPAAPVQQKPLPKFDALAAEAR